MVEIYVYSATKVENQQFCPCRVWLRTAFSAPRAKQTPTLLPEAHQDENYQFWWAAGFRRPGSTLWMRGVRWHRAFVPAAARMPFLRNRQDRTFEFLRRAHATWWRLRREQLRKHVEIYRYILVPHRTREWTTSSLFYGGLCTSVSSRTMPLHTVYAMDSQRQPSNSTRVLEPALLSGFHRESYIGRISREARLELFMKKRFGIK
jgi:hypothetical protein